MRVNPPHAKRQGKLCCIVQNHICALYVISRKLTFCRQTVFGWNHGFDLRNVRCGADGRAAYKPELPRKRSKSTNQSR